MTEFLVEISLHGTDHLDPTELDRLRKAESARAARLAAAGTLVRLWRTDEPGWRNLGLWRADSEAALHEAIASLPLSPYMEIVCRPLREHPNDPGW